MLPQSPNPPVPFALVLLLGALLANLASYYLARRLFRSSRPVRTTAESRADDADAGADGSDAGASTVTCPNCETENESGYRYCRACVSELPGSAPTTAGGSLPFGRFVR